MWFKSNLRGNQVPSWWPHQWAPNTMRVKEKITQTLETQTQASSPSFLCDSGLNPGWPCLGPRAPGLSKMMWMVSRHPEPPSCFHLDLIKQNIRSWSHSRTQLDGKKGTLMWGRLTPMKHHSLICPIVKCHWLHGSFFFFNTQVLWPGFFFFNLFIYFWLCWVFISVRGLSLVAASGGHSSSRCAGLSLSRPLLLQSTGSRCTDSVVVAHGPSCSTACGILPDQGSNPCPLHWQADFQPLRHQGSPFNVFLRLMFFNQKAFYKIILASYNPHIFPNY